MDFCKTIIIIYHPVVLQGPCGALQEGIGQKQSGMDSR